MHLILLAPSNQSNSIVYLFNFDEWIFQIELSGWISLEKVFHLTIIIDNTIHIIYHFWIGTLFSIYNSIFLSYWPLYHFLFNISAYWFNLALLFFFFMLFFLSFSLFTYIPFIFMDNKLIWASLLKLILAHEAPGCAYWKFSCTITTSSQYNLGCFMFHTFDYNASIQALSLSLIMIYVPKLIECAYDLDTLRILPKRLWRRGDVLPRSPTLGP